MSIYFENLALVIELSNNSNTRIEKNYIAEFKEGFSIGWKIPIPVYFRDALDIKLAPKVFKYEKIGDTKTKLVWTQGGCLHFQQVI
jgi:hypothetical protein